jgi:hypothetical protein
VPPWPILAVAALSFTSALAQDVAPSEPDASSNDAAPRELGESTLVPDVDPPPELAPDVSAASAASAPTATEAAASTAPAAPLAGYDDGFFIGVPDGLSKLRVRGLVQPRFALVQPTLIPGPDEDGSTWNASFAVQRAQIELLGHVFSKAVSFDLKTEFGRGAVFIKDAYIEAKVLDGVLLRGGLYKRPFQRQQMASDWKLAMFERNLTDESFKGGRDIGVSLHDGIDKGPPVEWSVGVYSGSSDKPEVTGDVIVDPELGIGDLDNVQIGNVPKLLAPTFVGRVGYNSSPILLPYSEIDIDGGGLRWGVSTSVLGTYDIAKDAAQTRMALDGIAKLEHVTATGALLLSLSQADPRSLAQSPDAVGGFLQAGVLLMDRFAPALRYSMVSKLDETVAHEIVANFTVLFFEQNVLWGIEGGSNVIDGVADLRLRTQAQIAF